MMPDKLYCWTGVLGSLYASPRKPEEVNAEEYLRKGALLEWAMEEMKNWSSESMTGQGVKMGISLVLDKIESL